MSVELTQGKTVTRLPAKAEMAMVLVAFVVIVASCGFWFASIVLGWQSLSTALVSILLVFMFIIMGWLLLAIIVRSPSPGDIGLRAWFLILLITSLAFAWVSVSNFAACGLTSDLIAQFEQIERERPLPDTDDYNELEFREISGERRGLIRERNYRLDQAGHWRVLTHWEGHALLTLTLWLPWR